MPVYKTEVSNVHVTPTTQIIPLYTQETLTHCDCNTQNPNREPIKNLFHAIFSVTRKQYFTNYFTGLDTYHAGFHGGHSPEVPRMKVQIIVIYL